MKPCGWNWRRWSRRRPASAASRRGRKAVMKCEEVSKELIGYLDRRANSAERRQVEEHLLECAACRTRAEEFRNVWSVLEEVPAIEPSFGFDARVRQRVAAEPQRRWFSWFVPQPRLAFSVAVLSAAERMGRETAAQIFGISAHDGRERNRAVPGDSRICRFSKITRC